MHKIKQLKPLGLTLAGMIALATSILISGLKSEPVKADLLRQETDAYCLSCHGDPELKMTLPDGETLSLYIPDEQFHNSIHSQAGIECEACHTEIKTYPHPAIDFETKRELSRSYYEACQKCHPSNYEKTMDSIHATAAAAGNLDAPICTDCHGAHDVKKAGEPRSATSTTCGTCHDKILNDYKNSIHGSALLEEENPDVPVCTDCHGVHNIQDPRTAQFRIESPDLCAGCHANAQLMEKYGLDADVYNLYNLSWHGVDVSVYKTKWPTTWHNSAVCTDCHGVHDILSAENPASSVNQANLLVTCQKCHPTAGSNWTDAWVGHNKIDPERTPFLYYTEQFYASFVPTVLWISVLYVLLQILHAIVDRVRRNLP